LTPEASIPRDVLAAEILEDARRKSERLLAQARREADAVLVQSRDRGDRERRDLVDAARAEAARRRERILAGVSVQQNRLRCTKSSKSATSGWSARSSACPAIWPRFRSTRTPAC
jgi:vacuolar-type H+-ATPase subunit H